MNRHRIIFAVCIILLIAGTGAAMAQTMGLQPGAHVRVIKKDGNIFEGKLVKTTTGEYQINTLQGMKVHKFLKDFKKISDTGKSDLGGGISYRAVHEYITLGDQAFQGVYFGGAGMYFDIDLGAYGVQKNISIESLKSIEVIPEGGAGHEQECTLICPHCGKPVKIRISK